MEGQTNKILIRSVAFLLVASAALYGLNDYLFSGIEWTPLRIPVELVEGREHTGDFVAVWGIVYEIRLDTDRNLNLQTQNCLLGMETVAPERCAGISPELILSWQVKANGELVAAGESQDSQAGYWGPSMGKILGAFQAVEGQSYRITATVGLSSPQLQQSNPRLQVAVAPRERKWTYVWAGLLIVIASGLLLLAIVLSILLVRRSSFRRDR
jgi:hypothetical protein